MLDLEQGDPDAAVRRLQEALAVMYFPVNRAHTLERLAWALQRRHGEGDLQRAKAALQECLTLLERMGDSRKIDRVRAELTALPPS